MRALTSAAAASFTLAVTAQSYPQVQMTYNYSYDISSTSVESLTCGSQLKAQGYATLGDIPHYPSIGASENVTDANSAACGTCILLQFAGNFASVLVVNHTDEGMVTSEQTMEWLVPEGNITQYPTVVADILGVSPGTSCGLSS